MVLLQAGADSVGTSPLDPAIAPAAVGAMLAFLGRSPDTVRAAIPASARRILVGNHEITWLQIVVGLETPFLSTWERVVPLLSHPAARLRKWAIRRLADVDLPDGDRGALVLDGDGVVEFDSAEALFEDLGI